MKGITKQQVADYSAYLKRKMMLSRILGILTCLFGFACIVLYYFKLVNDWMCLVVLAYCMGNAFSFNSNLQGVKIGNPWARLNAICSFAMYLLVVFLISYGFVSGNLTVKF